MRSAAAPPPSEPFDRHLAADCVRLVILLLLIYLILVTARVVYLRVRSRAERSAAEASPWGLASYCCFAAIPWVQGLGRFGHPLNGPRTVLTVAALATGAVAAYQQVTIHGWNWPPQRWLHVHRAGRRGAGE